MGLTWVIGPRTVNEFRAGFNRMNYSSGVPEPLFNVNGAQTPLPYFKLTRLCADGRRGRRREFDAGQHLPGLRQLVVPDRAALD